MMDDAHNYNTVPLEQDAAMVTAPVEVSRQEEVFDLPVPLHLLQTSPFYGYDDGEAQEMADEQTTTLGIEQSSVPESVLTFSPAASRIPFFSPLSSWLRRGNALRHLVLLVGGIAIILGLSMGTAFAQRRLTSTSTVPSWQQNQGRASIPLKPAKPKAVFSQVASTLPQKSIVVAQDNFQHDDNSTSWTTASDGQNSWRGDVGNGDFTIQNGVGLIAREWFVSHRLVGIYSAE
jgi:hypothetical protein